MAIWKRRRGYRGKVSTSQCYYGACKDADGIEHVLRLCEDKAASETILSEHRKRAALAAIGVVNPFEAHLKRSLAEHLVDYEGDLKARGRTPKHVGMTVQRCKAILDACKCQRIADLSASRMQKAAGALVDQGKGLVTVNHYLTAVKGLAEWLVKDRRMPDNPLVGLRTYNARTDLRHQRRALTADEVQRLLAWPSG
jgi:integrase